MSINKIGISQILGILATTLTGSVCIVAQQSHARPEGAYVVVNLFNTLGIGWDEVNHIDQTPFVHSGTFSIAGQEILPRGVFFKPDGLKMYIVGTQQVGISEYDLSVAWDITTAVYLQLFSVIGQDTVPTGVSFKSDGLKMYIIGDQNNSVYEYDLSVAWDVTAASYLQTVSIVAQETLPRDIFFKTNGSKMYIIGNATDSIHEYDLSVDWDITTAVYSQSFSVTGQDTVPTGLFFKPDGLKMYVTGFQKDNISEYDLSVAWDITTAVYLQLFSVADEDTVPTGLFFKPDGLKMYIVGADTDSVYEYTSSSTAWDISPTASDISETIEGTRLLSFSFNFYRANATQVASKFKTLLQSTASTEYLKANGLGLGKVGDIRDLTTDISAAFEDRTQMDVDFNIVDSEVLKVRSIQSLEIQGTLEASGQEIETTINIP